MVQPSLSTTLFLKLSLLHMMISEDWLLTSLNLVKLFFYKLPREYGSQNYDSSGVLTVKLWMCHKSQKVWWKLPSESLMKPWVEKIDPRLPPVIGRYPIKQEFLLRQKLDHLFRKVEKETCLKPPIWLIFVSQNAVPLWTPYIVSMVNGVFTYIYLDHPKSNTQVIYIYKSHGYHGSYGYSTKTENQIKSPRGKGTSSSKPPFIDTVKFWGG